MKEKSMNYPASCWKPSQPKVHTEVTQSDKARETPALTVALMTEQELSSRWQISIKTLQRWRGQQTGPKFIKLENRSVRYRLTDIETYEAERA
jgi:predicted DNA-binding transcriptional regulator AlpA